MSEHDHTHGAQHTDHHSGDHIEGDDAAAWDARYAAADQHWSGLPNEAVVAEASTLPAGRALDVGCGEGADTMWLAEQGWDVVAVDISEVAIQRAAMLSSQRDIVATWMPLDLTVEAPEPGMYDLVSAAYLPVLREAGTEPLQRVIDAVAPGGVLLWVAHQLSDESIATAREHGWDPTLYYDPAAVRALLPDGWTIEVDEPRKISRADAHHPFDVVLRARRDA